MLKNFALLEHKFAEAEKQIWTKISKHERLDEEEMNFKFGLKNKK